MSVARRMLPKWLFVAIPFIIILLVGLGGIRWYQNEQQATIEQTAKELEAIARLKVDQISNWRHERLGDAASMATNSFFMAGIRQYLASQNAASADQIRTYFAGLQRYYGYEDIFLVTPDGREALGLKAQSKHSGYQQDLTRALQSRQPVMMDLHQDPACGSPHLSVISPLFNEKDLGGQPLGAVILVADASQFLYPLIQSWPTPSTSAETLLVRRDGDSVLFLNELRHQRNAALQLRLPLSKTEVPAVMAVLGRQGLVQGKDYRGMPVTAVILPVPETPWCIVAKDDTVAIFAEWQSRAKLMCALLAVLALGIGVFGLYVYQWTRKKHFKHLYAMESSLRLSTQRHSIILQAIGDGVIATDAQGRVELLNPVAEALTGWRQQEACGKPLAEVFRIINEDSRKTVESPVDKVLREGIVVGLANHTLLLAKDGQEHPIADSAAPIRNEEGGIQGVVLIFRDQSEERRAQQITQARLELMTYGWALELEILLTNAAAVIRTLLGSPVGWYHCPEQEPRETTANDGGVPGGRLCPLSPSQDAWCQSLQQAGIFADCTQKGQPLLVNDGSVCTRPLNDLPLTRALVVPVVRDGKTPAFLVLGNKATAYTERDGELAAFLADVTWSLVERKLAEERLRTSERRYRTLYRSLMDAFVVVDMEGRVVECNSTFETMIGYSAATVKSKTLWDLTPKKWHESETRLIKEQVLPFGVSDIFEKEYQRSDGTIFPVELRIFLISDEQGAPIGMSAVVRDISDRKWGEREREKLQSQLLQAQKMESVGRLAGGVAHDFNNMLSVIIGYAELLLGKIEEHHPLYHEIQEILKAGKRSAAITKQLLAFARKQTVSPKVLDLNVVVDGMLKMLRRLIGEDVTLTWSPSSELKPVKIDPSQLDQILANLCVNARDAIAGVGTITIETHNITLDEDYCAHHLYASPGEFVCLTVSDSGCGMSAETLAMLFEPFFTTKALGEGTGLGLATVYGIVKQNNGLINVYSEPGQGASFKIYLPAYSPEGDALAKPRSTEALTSQGEVVLVVEDEAAILRLIEIILTNLGYVVLGTSTPNQALQLAEQYQGAIDLLLTDVVMPEMNGRELAMHIRRRFPKIKTLFMSGYTANVIAHRGILDPGVHFINKPLTRHELAVKIREALAGTPS